MHDNKESYVFYKNNKGLPIIMKFSTLGAICGFIVDYKTDNSEMQFFYTGLVTFLTIVYGYTLFISYKGKRPDALSKKLWKNIQVTKSYKKMFPILPNIVALPFMGAILADFLYQTYEATLVGIIIAFFLGVIQKFRLNAIISTIFWGFCGMVIALKYPEGVYETKERFQTYGTVGVFLGVIFSFIVIILLGAAVELLGINSDSTEPPDI